MKNNILFKAIKLNLDKNYPELVPFFNSIRFEENKISVAFVSKLQQINPTTLQVEEINIPTEAINSLNKHDLFLAGTFSGGFYTADFDSDKLELVSKIIRNVDSLTGEIVPPYSQELLQQEDKKIEVIKEQIAQSRKQADNWQAELENKHLPELKKKRLENQAFDEVVIAAKQAGLIN